MGRKTWGLIEGVSWRIVVVDGDEVQFLPLAMESFSSSARAEQIKEVLATLGYRGERILLGVESASCLVGRLERDRLPRGADATTMLYALEEQMPASAEELSATFLQGEDQILGIATSVERWQSLLEELDAEGIHVALLSPWSCLALQHALEDSRVQEADAVVLEGERNCDLFELRKGQVVGWSLHWSEEELASHLAEIGTERDRPSRIARVARHNSGLQNFGASWPPRGVEIIDVPHLDVNRAAVRAMQTALSGHRDPLVDLRTGPLADVKRWHAVRGLVVANAVLIFLTLISLVGMLEWRTFHYRQIAHAHQRQQEEIFHQTHPGQQVPLGVRSRLESEVSRLKGLAAESAVESEAASALNTLVQAIQAMPDDLRFRLTRMSVVQEKLSADGEVLKLADASTIVESLKVGGFVTSGPATVQGREGYTLAISAVWPGRGLTEEGVP